MDFMSFHYLKMSNFFIGNKYDGFLNPSTRNKKPKKLERRPYSEDNSNCYFIHYDPVDPDWECIIREFLIGCHHPYSEIFIPSNWPTNVRSAVRKLLLAMDGYIAAAKTIPIPIDRLLDLAASLEGQKTLKKARKDCFITKFNLKSFDTHEHYDVECIGDMFNYRYAINYDEEPEDYKLGLLPVNINEKTLQEFKDAVENFLPDEFDLTDEEIDYDLSVSSPCNSSMCINNTFDFKSVPTHKSIANPQFDEPELCGKRVVIPISAQNTRDAVMLTTMTSDYIRVLDKIIIKMFQHNSWFTMISNKEAFLRRLKKFRTKHNFFVCFDFEKEGITKPRELIIAVLEEIYKKYPLQFFKKCIDIYSSYTLYLEDDDIEIEMKRGHGLGMANALTSVVIITLLSVVLARMQEDTNCTMKGMDFDVLSFNDDTTISIKKEFFIDFEEYFYITVEELSMRYKREKTFWGREFVFCEEYSNSAFNNKNAYFSCALYTACMCVNITQAKSFISSLNLVEVLDNSFDFILDEFGFEFYEEEIYEPICFGGWFSKSIYGVDLSWHAKSDFTFENIAAMYACQAGVKRARSKTHPFLERNDEPLMFSLPMVERLHGKKYQKYWDKLYKKRQTIYYEKQLEEVDIVEAFCHYRKSKLKDVLAPNLPEFSKQNVDKLISTNADLYYSKRPIWDYLENDKAMSFLIGDFGDYKRLTGHEIRERLIYLGSTSNITIMPQKEIDFLTSTDLEKSYWRPERVVEAWKCLYPTGFGEVPYLYDERIQEIKNKYDIKLSDEYLNFTKLVPERTNHGLLSNFMWKYTLSAQDLYNAFAEYSRNQLELDLALADKEDDADFCQEIGSIIGLTLSDLGNDQTESHKKLKTYINFVYNCYEKGSNWIRWEVTDQLLVPRLNLDWYKTHYSDIMSLDQIYGFEDLSNSGWFKFSKITFDGCEFHHPVNIIPLPAFKVREENLGGKAQDQIPVQIIVPSNITIEKNDESSSSEELNAGNAFDLLEGMEDW